MLIGFLRNYYFFCRLVKWQIQFTKQIFILLILPDDF